MNVFIINLIRTGKNKVENGREKQLRDAKIENITLDPQDIRAKRIKGKGTHYTTVIFRDSIQKRSKSFFKREQTRRGRRVVEHDISQ